MKATNTMNSTVEPISERHTNRSFHISLNVGDLDKTIAFFSIFFGCPPAKRRSDYAKFEIADPPLVLSLEPQRVSTGGVLNHVGIRMSSVDSLVEMQKRLESSGMPTQRMDGVECCYARQTKFWVHDPDGVLWEVYTLDEDIEHHGFSGTKDETNEALATSDSGQTEVSPASQVPPAAVWSHRLGQQIPARLFVNDASVDEIHLQGTFNAITTKAQRLRLLEQCCVAIKETGFVMLHQLTSDQQIESDQLGLPGAAAVVQQVLPIDDLTAELTDVGFVEIDFQKYGQRPCFVREGVEMRETMLIARKRSGNSEINTQDKLQRRVLFKGPADAVTHQSITLRRGKTTEVSASVAEELHAILGDQLVVFGNH
ncbi:ArsI/CadI family heavy metal resistance metalloenzyme [Gimesia maris]|uniref:ArsI/CadI family heavy metal resistance metalloenzyme n=1 Tax=Gimesia maris TaxID=122 RepID=UPI003A901544